MKRIVRKQDPFLASNAKCPQTMPARSVTTGNFSMCRMAISRCLHRGSHNFSYFGGYRNHAQAVHNFSSRSHRKAILRFCSAKLYPLSVVNLYAIIWPLDRSQIRAPSLGILEQRAIRTANRLQRFRHCRQVLAAQYHVHFIFAKPPGTRHLPKDWPPAARRTSNSPSCSCLRRSRPCPWTGRAPRGRP